MLASMTSDTAGRRIGPYVIERELGRGGMGAVYQVRHPDVPRPLALKVIASGADPVTLTRLEREATLLAEVRHSNVVAVHAFARAEDGRPYVVMDLIPGQNLRSLARSGLEPARAAAIVRAIASAVEALHARSILHRDLKPENVIVRDDGEPVLLDFGLARHLDAKTLTQSGALLGTPAYMSPEQAEGAGSTKLDARTDVYGLGTILFELLAGRPPFDGTQLQIVTAVLTKEPVWPAAPATLAAVLRKAMAKDPAERYPTARALGEDLARFLASDRVEDARSARAPAVVAVVVALAGVAAALAVTRGRGEDVPSDSPAIAPVPTPAAPSKPRETSPLPSNEPTVRSFRDRRRWLAENETDPRRKTVEDQVTLTREKWLIKKKVGEGVIVVRFLSNRHLAFLGDTPVGAKPVVGMIDVEGDATPNTAWTDRDEHHRGSRVQTITRPVHDPTVFLCVRDVIYRATYDERTGQLEDSRPQEWSHADLRGSQGDSEDDRRLKALAVSPSGRFLAAGGHWDKVVLSTIDGKERRTLGSFAKRVESLAFSPDESLLAVGSYDGVVKILRIVDGDPVHGWKMSFEVPSVAFSPDGKMLAVGFENGNPLASALGPSGWEGPRSLCLDSTIDVVSSVVFRSEPLTIFGVTANPDGQPNGIRSWHREGTDWRSGRSRSETTEMHSVDLSPDGNLLAVGTRSGEVEVWPTW
jgi:serine/threonine protein kinase/WD40 repeat protein